MATPTFGNIGLTINQVEHLTGVPKSTLRFWERTFTDYLAVARSPGKQRQYSQGDVQKVLTLRTLLRDEQYTILGAKKRLSLQDAGESASRGEGVSTPAGENGKPRLTSTPHRAAAGG
ncbi:MAG: MerR family transcriptional regulator [Planctomycetes bacterium]|nr:MerR family transcriptional regulator [Planctomycetota bacterium]